MGRAYEKVTTSAVLALLQLSSRQVLIIYRKLAAVKTLLRFYRRYFINMEQVEMLTLLKINLYMLNCRVSGREIACAKVQESLRIMNLGIGLSKRTQKVTDAEMSKALAFSVGAVTDEVLTFCVSSGLRT